MRKKEYFLEQTPINPISSRNLSLGNQQEKLPPYNRPLTSLNKVA
jgi:hypothetical protein